MYKTVVPVLSSLVLVVFPEGPSKSSWMFCFGLFFSNLRQFLLNYCMHFLPLIITPLFITDDYLGFYNRTCGSQSPRSVGPTLRSSSALTWRQWVVTVTAETDSEQWGYLETYYPEERGAVRYVMYT